MKHIIIFGASLFGEKVFNYYKNNKEINIISFCDNDASKHNTMLFDTKIILPQDIFKDYFDEIVIASSYEQEIKKQLIDMQICESKIVIFHTNTEDLQLKNNDLLLIAKSLMFDIADLFNENSIHYHIDHGTLLGLVRDNQILPWDIDIDFAIPAQEKDKVIKIFDSYLPSYINKYSLINKWSYFINEDTITLDKKNITAPMYITIVNDINNDKTTIGLDIHLKYSHGKNLYWMVAQRRLKATQNLCFPTIDFAYENKKLKIPNDANSYLTELYGDWKTPVKQWDYSKYSNIDYICEYKNKEIDND